MTRKRHWYRGYQLTLDSDFAIPGAIEVPQGTGQADIVIRSGAAEIGPVNATNGPYFRSGDALVFDVPGVARYLAETTSHLVIAPYAGADPEHVSALIVATALPMMLWIRGGLVLHAAGLIVPGASAAIALAGPSGIGKSSLAHLLMAGGAKLLGDDTLLLSEADGRSVVSGLPASYFLQGLSEAPRMMHRVPPVRQAESADLGAIIILNRSGQGRVEAPSRVSGLAALEALLQNRHRPRVPAIMGYNGALLTVITRHCRNVPIYRLACPENDPAAARAGLGALIDGIKERY